ncbi:dienelactone hydrolase [Saccharothrix sp. NRRL B-16348]|uniref:dienelactone hydrolase family protein n=1 Tax=Saccharothrix sp. NRRL B-16348 TaxID=1415542 RepID=UPI0006AFC5AF|nr:dienelactone hydrolase family protein [Saccharothrix sp. NRRL B-16348]KOX21380.1 dienelactone hydrolase [Saccharothrix sp. NRRL B-16348]
MAGVLLFHHVQGLTPGVREFAEQLRAAGHTVHTPDLFDGRVFDKFEDGVAHAEEIGFGTILDRGRAAADNLPPDLFYAGFSLGVLPAQMLAQTRPGAKGALLCGACIPVSEFGSGWPADVPVQVHAMEDDAVFVGDGDLEAARALVTATPAAELFLYPGDQHLFADPGLPGYTPAAADLLLTRTRTFLS